MPAVKAWVPPPALVTTLADIYSALQTCTKKPKQLWPRLEEQAAPLDAAFLALFSALQRCPAPPAQLLQHLLDDGTLFTALPRTVRSLFLTADGAGQSSSPPVGNPVIPPAGSAIPWLLAGRSAAQATAACKLLNCLLLVCRLALYPGVGTADRQVLLALQALQTAGLLDALPTIVAFVNSPRAQYEKAAAGGGGGLYSSGLAARLVGVLLQLCAAPALRNAGAAAVAAVAAAYCAALVPCISHAATVVMWWPPESVYTPPVGAAAAASGTWGEAAADVVEAACLFHSDPRASASPVPAARAPAAAAAWRSVKADLNMARLALRMVYMSGAPYPPFWCHGGLPKAVTMLYFWLHDPLLSDTALQHAVDTLPVTPSMLGAMARLALPGAAVGSVKQLGSVMGAQLGGSLGLLLPLLPHGAAEPWPAVAAYIQGVLAIHPATLLRSGARGAGASSPELARGSAAAAAPGPSPAGAGVAAGGHAPSSCPAIASVFGAMAMLAEFTQEVRINMEAGELDSGHVMVLNGLLARCEVWLRAPVPLTPDQRQVQAHPAFHSLANLAFIALQQPDPAVLSAVSATCLSVAATLRKLCAIHCLAPPRLAEWELLPLLLLQLLQVTAVRQRLEARSPVPLALVRCLALQLMPPLVPLPPLGSLPPSAAASPPQEGWSSRPTALLPLMHRCGLADMTAAAGAPSHLQEHLERLLEVGPGLCALGLAQGGFLALESAMPEPGWLMAAGLIQGVDRAVAAAAAAPPRWWDGAFTGRARSSQAAEAALAVSSAQQALARIRLGVQALPPDASEPTWDSCLLATAALAAGGCDGGGGRPFFGCWHRGCTNLDGASEASLKLLKCSLCHSARYCSVECQKAAWQAGHRVACKAWKARQVATAPP